MNTPKLNWFGYSVTPDLPVSHTTSRLPPRTLPGEDGQSGMLIWGYRRSLSLSLLCHTLLAGWTLEVSGHYRILHSPGTILTGQELRGIQADSIKRSVPPAERMKFCSYLVPFLR